MGKLMRTPVSHLSGTLALPKAFTIHGLEVQLQAPLEP